jgi:hypothetical protein
LSWSETPVAAAADAAYRGGIGDALRRLRAARELGVGDLDLSRVPPGRLKLLARSATTARAQAIQRTPLSAGWPRS